MTFLVHIPLSRRRYSLTIFYLHTSLFSAAVDRVHLLHFMQHSQSSRGQNIPVRREYASYSFLGLLLKNLLSSTFAAHM